MAQSLASAAEQQHSSLSNSAARAETIREAVHWLAEREREVQAINADIREYKTEHIKGNLGFKLSDWAAIYRVSQLEIEDRDTLLETIREGFAALHIGGVMDWVAAAESTRRRRGGPSANGGFAQAQPDNSARLDGHHDGLGGVQSYAEHWPPGEPGYADYMLGLADGEAERGRALALGNGHDAGGETPFDTAPKRGRGRPRKQPQEAEADAEF